MGQYGELLKENIILSSAAANKSFVYDCSVDGLTPVLENNEIYFKDSKGETILYIHAPFMYDSGGSVSDAVALSLKENGSGWQIGITADDAWLNDAARAFPVVIDPVISTPTNYYEIKDARVCSNYPNSNFRDYSLLTTGYGTNTGDNRSYIQFNLPAMNSADVIVNAQMVLTSYSESKEEKQVNVHNVYSAWDSGTITWNNKPDYQKAVTDYVVFKDTFGEQVSFNITDIVKGWYRGKANHGLMIKDSMEEGRYTEFLSSDCAEAYSEQRPRIYITYINASGLEDFWTYHSQDIGRAGAGYVNDYTGNMVLVHQTAATYGLKMPISLSHVYNSNDKETNIGYGYGFRLNYHQTVASEQIGGIQYYKYIDEDGTRHYFYYDTDKKEWLVDSGIDLKLIIGTSSSEKYTIEDKESQKLMFNGSGYLVKVQDANGNALSITYTGNKISKITDGAGRVITLSYDSSGNLNKAVSPDGTKTFSYINGNLTAITDTDGKKISYTYDGHLLKKAANIDGYSMNYSYTSSQPYKVSKVTEMAGTTEGQSVDISYGNYTNWFMDNKGRYEEYAFNAAGNTTTIFNDEGYAESAKFITEGTNKNKVSKISKLQYTVVQMLKNPNVTSLSSWSSGVSGDASCGLNTAAANAKAGSNSLKVTAGTGSGWFYQKVTVEKGKDYTFSAYVRPDHTLTENKGCEVRIRYKNSSGNDTYADSTEFIPCEDGWYRMECTAQVPSNSTSTDAYVFVMVNKTGTAYFDCLQMESGKTANRYNLIENNDFRNGSAGFTFSGTKTFDHVENTDTPGDSAPKEKAAKGIVTASALNVRSGPGTNNGVVASVSLNQRVFILGSANDPSGTVWYHIAWASGQRVYYGYASSAYISKDNSNVSVPKALINTTTLNVRAGAGTGYSVIATVSRDTEVVVLQSITSTNSQTWYMIHFTKNGTKYTGCVLSDYVLTQENIYDIALDPPAVHGGELDNNVMAMYGNPGGVKRASQTIAVSGSAGDAYVVNAWGIGYTVALKDSRSFGVEVEFTYTDGTKEAFVRNFAENGINWMFLNDVVIAQKAYTSVKASYIYGYNENVVYFDGLSLYKEEYGSSYVYDSKGNVTSTVDAAKKANSFEYDSSNNMTKLVDAKGNNFKYTYDTHHNVTEAVSAANVKYTFAYDTYGNATESRIVNPANVSEFIKTTAAYGSSGNFLTSVTDPLGNTVSYTYDVQKGKLTKAADAMGTDTNYTYNAKGQVTSVSTDFKDSNGLNLSAYSSYIYNNDYLTGIDFHGYRYSFVYDGFGNKTEVKQGENTLVSYIYEVKNGNLLEETYGNGLGFSYIYDDFDRVTTVCYKTTQGDVYGTELYKYSYSKDGNLAVLEECLEGMVYRYYYDLSDRLVKVVDNRGNFYTYYYDANDNLVKVDEGSSAQRYMTSYTYDADNRETATILGEQTDTAAKKYTTAYDGLGRITKKAWNTTTPFNMDLSYSLGANGSQSAQLKSVSNNGSTISYTYNANGNMTSVTDPAGTSKYYYDELNQLIREDNHLTGKTVIYLYDACGNILSKKIYPKTDAQTVSGTPEDTIHYGYDEEWTDKLVSYDGSEITYDNIGNPLSYMGKSMTWHKENLLYHIAWNGGEYTYSYNKDGIRTLKTNETNYGTTSYQLTDGLIVSEVNSDADGNTVSRMVFTYDSDDTLIAMRYNGTQYFYMKNGMGDIIGIVDGAGNVVVNYAYDSWGKVLDVTGNTELGNANPFRYRGYYYDRETGFYYLYSRYYDPEVGRFINADDTAVLEMEADISIQDNLFAYCLNNPVNMVDESGDLPSWATKLIIGTAVIAAVAVVTVATAGTGGALACFAAGALKGAVAGAVSGAAQGAVSGAITHRVTTGSWKGAGKAALNGAADGYMKGAVTGAIAGGIASKACFVAGTPVLTEDGRKARETVETGDLVWAKDPETGEQALKEVVQTFVNESRELVHVFAGGEEIVTTPEHPFYVPQKGWTGAVHLRAGDILVLVNGEYVVVEQIQHEILETPVKVYNFEVADFHTYYVGDRDVLVHNMCKVSKNPGRSGRQKQLRKIANDPKVSKTIRGEMKNIYKQKGYYRTPIGYNLAHRAGYEAKKGYDYSHTVLQLINDHKAHHRIMGKILRK